MASHMSTLASDVSSFPPRPGNPYLFDRAQHPPLTPSIVDSLHTIHKSMDAQTVRQRSKEGFSRTDDKKTIDEKKLAKAQRGLRSLAVAVFLPLVLSLLSFFLSSLLQPKSDGTSHVRRLPAWTLQVGAEATAGLMGLAAWLVWADGGMRTPAPVILYAAQLALGLAWAPFSGAGPVGLVLSLANVAVLTGCWSYFGQINPFAGNLVSPCMVWAAFLALLSFWMM